MKHLAQGTLLAAAIALLPTLAWAQDPATPARPVTVTVGADVPTDYYFRGYIQEAEGFIIQPYVDVGFNLTDTVSVHVGWWNSAHSADATGTLYESDPWASVNFTAGSWSASALYTLYTYPSDLFEEIHELACWRRRSRLRQSCGTRISTTRATRTCSWVSPRPSRRGRSRSPSPSPSA